MDEKSILQTVSNAPDGEMLGTPPGFLRDGYAAAVEAGHLEVMRAPDATTVIGHRITQSGRDFLAGGATAPVTPAETATPADPAEEPVPAPEQEPTAPPPPESAPAPEPAPAETTPPVPAATETPDSAPEAKPTA